MITTRNKPIKRNFNDRRMLAVGSLLVLLTLIPARGFAQSVATSTTAVEPPPTVTQAEPAATPLVRLVLRSGENVPAFLIYFRQPDGRWVDRCATPCSLRVVPSTITLASSRNGENAATVTVTAAGLDATVFPPPHRVISQLQAPNPTTTAYAGSPGMFYGGLITNIVGAGLGFTFLGFGVNSLRRGRDSLSLNLEPAGWLSAAVLTPVILVPIGIALMVAGTPRPAQNNATPTASLRGVAPIVTAEFQGVSVVGQF